MTLKEFIDTVKALWIMTAVLIVGGIPFLVIAYIFKLIMGE